EHRLVQGGDGRLQRLAAGVGACTAGFAGPGGKAPGQPRRGQGRSRDRVPEGRAVDALGTRALAAAHMLRVAVAGGIDAARRAGAYTATWPNSHSSTAPVGR